LARTSFGNVKVILKSPSLDPRTPTTIIGELNRHLLIGVSHFGRKSAGTGL
jgi:hypothetical protein